MQLLRDLGNSDKIMGVARGAMPPQNFQKI